MGHRLQLLEQWLVFLQLRGTRRQLVLPVGQTLRMLHPDDEAICVVAISCLEVDLSIHPNILHQLTISLGNPWSRAAA